MDSCKGTWKEFVKFYTPVFVDTHDSSIGIINRLIQVAITLYVIIYSIILMKGYQNFDQAHGISQIIVRGHTDGDGEYEISYYGDGGVAIWTHIQVTANQTYGSCPEDPSVICKQDDDCKKGKYASNGHGSYGKCIFNDVENMSTCAIDAWCPFKENVTPSVAKKPDLSDIKNLSILVKTYAVFPRFGVKKSNLHILESSDCSNSNKDPSCPFMLMKNLLSYEDFHDVALKGAVVAINVHWMCNIDLQNLCEPSYTVYRLDNKFGFHQRYVKYKPEINQRELQIKYGVRIKVFTTGSAGKFNFFALIIHLISGLGFITVATVACSLLYCMHLRWKEFMNRNFQMTVINETSDNMPGLDIFLSSGTSQPPDVPGPGEDTGPKSPHDAVPPVTEIQFLEKEIMFARKRRIDVQRHLQEEKDFCTLLVRKVKTSDLKNVGQEIADDVMKRLMLVARIKELQEEYDKLCEGIEGQLEEKVINVESTHEECEFDVVNYGASTSADDTN